MNSMSQPVPEQVVLDCEKAHKRCSTQNTHAAMMKDNVRCVSVPTIRLLHSWQGGESARGHREFEWKRRTQCGSWDTTHHWLSVGRIGYAPCLVTHGTQATRHNHVRFGRPDEHRGVAAPRNHTHTRVDKCAYVIEFQLSVSHSPLLTSDHIGEREGEIVANAANDHQ